MLYLKYCNAMYSTAFRILGNREDANDALQEAFIQVFRDMAKFRNESSVGTWIRTIVVRSALKKIRNGFTTVTLDPAEHDVILQIPPQLPAEYLEKIILSLPAGYRAVFLLIEVEGYTHKEVATMLGISQGTSKSQLFYAKKQLQKLLKDVL